MTIEDLNAMVLTDPDELAAIYGSLEFARARFDHLVATGQERRRPGMLPSGIFWLTEPGVPHELRQLVNFPGGGPDDEVWDDDVWDALNVARWRWFAKSGYIADADRDDITK